MSPYDQAKQRVENTPELQEYADEILYEWEEGNEHWQWVLAAPIPEIVDWAKVIRANAPDTVE